jgi:hypothetical protein
MFTGTGDLRDDDVFKYIYHVGTDLFNQVYDVVLRYSEPTDYKYAMLLE